MKLETTLLMAAFGLIMSATLTLDSYAGDATLQSVQSQLAALKTKVATLQSQLDLVRNNPVLAIGPYVSLDLNSEQGVRSPNIVFKGANVHIVDGSGITYAQTGIPSGLGNLFIGYNELANFPNLIRNGQHCLVMGDANAYSGSANVVFGQINTVLGFDNLCLGGASNTILGPVQAVDGYRGSFDSVILGGYRNSVQGINDSIVGGHDSSIVPTAGGSTFINPVGMTVTP